MQRDWNGSVMYPNFGEVDQKGVKYDTMDSALLMANGGSGK